MSFADESLSAKATCDGTALQDAAVGPPQHRLPHAAKTFLLAKQPEAFGRSLPKGQRGVEVLPARSAGVGPAVALSASECTVGVPASVLSSGFEVWGFETLGFLITHSPRSFSES